MQKLNNTVPKLAERADTAVLEHVRLQTPSNWGPLGGDTLIKSGGKFHLDMHEHGILVTLTADGVKALIPFANVKFAVFK